MVESGRGRPRVDLALKLRLHCLQQWYALSGPATKEKVKDSQNRGHSAGQALEARMPDKATLCRFRRQLKSHVLGTWIS